MSRQQLLDLIDEGHSIRAIATRLGRSPTSVRYWLLKYGLTTRNAPRRSSVVIAQIPRGIDVELVCRRHGVTRHRARAEEEAQKCLLLCANCHAEVEAGVATLSPLPLRTIRGSSIGRAARC
jgi:hypothetical protein